MTDIEDNDAGMQRLLADLKRLDGASVTAGIHEAEGAQDDGDGTTVAEVGARHEFGYGPPQRAWLAPTIDENEPELQQFAGKVIERVVEVGGRATIQTGLEVVGERMVQMVQAKIRDSDPGWQPLAEATKRKKAEKGRLTGAAREAFIAGDGNPLVDTGQLLNSVTRKVELGGGA